MEFEWDARKAAANLRKHRVSFEEAATVFGNPMALTFEDPAHATRELRFLTFGVSVRGILLTVSHCERGRRTRLISARRAAPRERSIYEEG